MALILISGLGVFAAESVLRLDQPAPTDYRADQSVSDFTIPHGDIAVLGPDMPADVREPRVVRFATDSLGLRNDADYENQPFVANGSDQDDTLSSILTRVHAMATYNAGFPSGPESYGGLFRHVMDGHSNSVRDRADFRGQRLAVSGGPAAVPPGPRVVELRPGRDSPAQALPAEL